MAIERKEILVVHPRANGVWGNALEGLDYLCHTSFSYEDAVRNIEGRKSDLDREYNFLITGYKLVTKKTGVDIIKKVSEVYDGGCKMFLILEESELPEVVNKKIVEEAIVAGSSVVFAEFLHLLDDFGVSKFVDQFLER